MAARSISSEELTSMARTVLGTTLGLKKGETVLIEAWTNSLPYAEVFQREARKMGVKPLVLFEGEPGYWEAVGNGGAKTIGEPPKAEWEALKAADAYVYFWGPSDRDRFRALPERLQNQLTAYNGRWYTESAKYGVRAVRMELALAEPKAAEALGADLDDWRAELVAACAADPRKMKQMGQKLAARLAKGGEVHITHPNGTDVRFKIPKGRRVTLDDGIIDAEDLKKKNNVANVPAGSLVVTLDEKFGEGTVAATRTTRFENGRKRVEGARWEFRGGKLASRSTQSDGGEYEAYFAKGAKGKDVPGLLEIGLNPAMRDAPNFEDQELGTVSIYVGGNNFYGGKNKVNFMGYLMLQGADVELDGKPLLKGGKPA